MHFPKVKRSILITITLILILTIAGALLYAKNRRPYKEKLWQVYYYKVRLLLPLKKIGSDREIISAVQRNSHETVEAILRKDRSKLNVCDMREGTPAGIAVSRGDERMTALLIAAGKDPEDCLGRAAMAGKDDIMKLLIAAGANPGRYFWGGSNALHIAAHYGRIETIMTLIKNGVKVDSRGPKSRTALHIASNFGIEDQWFDRVIEFRNPDGYRDIVRLLISLSADVNAKDVNGQTPLHVTAGIVHKVFDPIFYKGGNNDFQIKVKEESLNIAKILVESGADLESGDDKGRTPLIVAIQAGNRKVANYLLDKGAKMYDYEGTGESGEIRSIRDVDLSALHAAAFWGLEKVAGRLIPISKLINKKQKRMGLPPIIMAMPHMIDPDNSYYDRGIDDRRRNILKLLITNGADIEIKDIDNETPLFAAIEIGNVETVELLVKAGANVNAKSEKGYTPLHSCMDPESLSENPGKIRDRMLKQMRIAEILISDGAKINETDRKKRTPLHYAVKNKNYDMVRFLISHGADVEMRDYLGKTPLDYGGGDPKLSVFGKHGPGHNSKSKRQ